MRLVFMGTPTFAVPTLLALADAGHDIAAVYTRAPKPGGRRGLAEQLSPVHVLAQQRGFPVVTPKTLRDAEAQQAFARHGAQAAVVVAYGLILPKEVLDAPAHGCLNIHGSLLPRWRGAAPLQRALMAGDADTGVMIMGMEEGLDTGPVAMTARVAITPATTAGDLHDVLAREGADLAVAAIVALERGALAFVPQPNEGVTYAAKIDKGEARIDWRAAAAIVRNHIHGLSPAPGAWFEADFGRGPERVKVLRANVVEGEGAPGASSPGTWLGTAIACGAGALAPVEVQRAGRPPMAFAEFLRGVRIATGTVLA